MDNDFRAFLETPDPGAKPVRRRGGYNAFGWTVSLLLLSGVVMASWIASFYVYNHPENPACYHLLKQVNRIEAPKRFDLTAAPPGKFFSAKELYDTYLMMSPEELDAKNNDLLRNYLRNYAQTKTPVPYIWGRFTTAGVYELGKSDMFPSGMVAVADSVDCPQVRIEHIYPTGLANVPRARQMLATEPEIRLEKSFSLATIVHVGKLDDGRMLFTVMPLDYGPYAYKQGLSSTFRLDPPAGLNLEASLPVVKPDAMENAVKTFALYRKNKGLLAKGKMLTLPPTAPAASQTTDLYATRDIPPEAYQPYKPASTVDAPPSDEPTPVNTVADNAAPATPPTEELTPVTTPSSAAPEATAQTTLEPPAAPSAAVAPPVAPVSQSAPAPPAASVPAIAKTSLPAPPSVVASTAPATPSLTREPALVKQDKTIAKTSVSALPSPAPAVRQVARIQPAPSPAAVTAATHPVIAKPKVSILASVPQAPPKPAPVPVVERSEPYPSPTPVEYVQTVPPESPAPNSRLEPFFAPQPQPQQPQQQAMAPARSTAWQTYSPGLMPRGKLINMDEAPQLADLGIGRERLYIDGRFIVTASSDGRAVLRPVGYNGAISGTSVRMVVEYPNGARIPMEGTQIARGTLRPFQIMDVRRGDDGQVNVYAREVTVPMNQAPPHATRDYRYRVVQQNNSPLD